MTEKIAQHRHCRQCGKAFVGADRVCSEECGSANAAVMKKKKRQLLMLYGVTFVILILALLLMGLG